MLKKALVFLIPAFLAGVLPVYPQIISDMLHESTRLTVTETETSGKQQTVVLESTRLSGEYNGVLFQGFSDAADIQAEVRYSTGDAYSEWQAARVIRSASDDGSFAGGLRTNTFRAGGWYQVRFTINAEATINLIASGVFDNRLDADQEVSPAKAGGRQEFNGVSQIQPPPLITRQDWGADPFIRGEPVDLAPFGVQYMTFHHAAGFSATTREEGVAQVKAIQDLHQNIRGWSDIGYQFVIDRGGRVYQGRPFLDGSSTLEEIPALARGAHVGGANTGNIGVCLLGCYHPPEGSHCAQQPTTEALDTYVTMFAFLSESYDVEPSRIRGHRDFSSTACPGDNNYGLLPGIIADVEDVIVFGNEQPDSFALEDNYPNPVSGNTTFRYFLEESGVVSIKIFDLAGRQIADILNEFQEGPRWHSIDFDAGALASGLYYYRVSVDGFGGLVFDRAKPLVVVSP